MITLTLGYASFDGHGVRAGSVNYRFNAFEHIRVERDFNICTRYAKFKAVI